MGPMQMRSRDTADLAAQETPGGPLDGDALETTRAPKRSRRPSGRASGGGGGGGPVAQRRHAALE